MSSEMQQPNSAASVGTKDFVDRRARATHGQAPVQVKVLGGTRANENRFGVRSIFLWLAAGALVLLAIPVYQGMLYKPGNGFKYFSYWIGIIGSVMMLLMLLYPVRKHLAFARNWGALRYWFMLHMMFGIGGPILVLFHTTFHAKSLNAIVSLSSMLLVAISGIVGRFIYRHIHQGLYGRHSNLKELQAVVDSSHEKIGYVLMEAPNIGEKLNQFHDMAMQHGGPLPKRIWRFISMTWRHRSLAKHCSHELRRAVILLAKSQHWDAAHQEMHWREAVQKVESYLSAVQQAAQFAAYERMFRLWHILHSPFVWLLAISAVVHVIAVNMY
jgi:hypothetical protein